MKVHSLRFRLAALAALVLAVSLGLSLLLSVELQRAVGQRDLDQSLARELTRFTRAVQTSAVEQGGTATVAVAERAVNDYYRLNPGSTTYLTVVRLGTTVFVSPTPPVELADAARSLAIPAGTVDGYETLPSPAGPLRSLRTPVTIDATVIGSVQVVGRAQPISDATAESLIALGALAGICMLVGGSALALAIVRSLRPLRALADTAQRTGHLDQLSVRVAEPRRADEVGVLAREFNRMLGRLEDSARARTEFLATVSHELRTPVTIARGHLETLERSGAADPERVRATTRVVREELTHVGRLVDDLLALARAGLDDFVAPREVPLDRFFADLELRLEGLALPQVEMLPPPGLTIRADPARLQQALLNLAVNATVHTPPGTRVIISAQHAGDRVALTVADDGPGIPDDVAARVLEPFVRATSGGHDSSGLGLAVVDEVARAHGGRVTVDTGPGGTAVTLDVPVSGPP
ncbi:HAMP domain-containing sensor histidine kinase [Pseudonocardia sp.]|uniref:HAMP domain-containing sensor histidine kinase n=1 Tax=Pseudonocardia sp. TaxID=60912 RepID=UPI0026044743|nr:HAMP domain-containing sensor histidine kinase [Pseudonocardia sp.]